MTFFAGTFVRHPLALAAAKAVLLHLKERGLALQTPDGVWITVIRGTAPVAVPYGDWINLPVQIDWFATEPP